MSNSELHTDIDGSILLDTNVLIPLLLGNAETHGDITTRLKIAALTCRHFLITQTTLEELQRWARALFDGLRVSNQPPRFIGLPLNGGIIDTYEKAINEGIDQLLKRDIFQVISEHDLIESIAQTDLSELESRVAEHMLQGTYPPPLEAIEHDARLILTAKALALPIFTMDLRIIKVAGEVVSELEVPFPFDIDAIAQIELDDLIDLAAPMRELYRKAFVKLNEDIATIEDFQTQLRHKEAFVANQNKIMEELRADLQRAQAASKQWQDLARPKVSEAIVWTVAETLLGLVPFPIPTTPVTFFVQVFQYRKVEKHQQSQSNE